MMFKNQYLITSGNFEEGESPTLSWCDFKVYLGDSTKYAYAHKKSDALIIGTLVDYRNIKNSINDICDEISYLNSKKDIIEFNNHLTGRYCLFFKTPDGIYALGDACSLKRILFARINNNTFITSSEQYYYDLSGDTASIKPSTQSTIDNQDYQKKESPWYGLQSIDHRFSFVLGNHILDIIQLKVSRIPTPKTKQHASDDEAIQYAANIFQNSLDALIMQHSVVLPVTAGYDSRALLAASFKHKDKVKYYVFGDENANIDDIVVPKKLAERFNFKLDIIKPEDLSQNFVEQFKKTSLNARVLPKTRNIQYHFNHTNSDTININGNTAEIFRSVYGQPLTSISAETLAFLSRCKKHPELTQNIYAWYDLATDYAKQEKISIGDLFYWEQRMSIWGSLFPLEQDIAIEEISPFNNRYFIFNMLRTSKKLQKGPKYLITRKLIGSINPEFLEVPINPSSSELFSFVKSNTGLKTIQLKIKKMIKKYYP